MDKLGPSVYIADPIFWAHTVAELKFDQVKTTASQACTVVTGHDGCNTLSFICISYFFFMHLSLVKKGQSGISRPHDTFNLLLQSPIFMFPSNLLLFF